MMRLLALVLVLIAAPVFGQGWNDFTIELDDGFAIHKLNSSDVVLSYEADGIDIFIIGGGEDGPIHRYAETKTHIAVHCLLDQEGRYFLVTKSDRVVVGPLTEAQLRAEGIFAGVVLDWKQTVRPGWRWVLFGGIGVLVGVGAMLIRVCWTIRYGNRRCSV